MRSSPMMLAIWMGAGLGACNSAPFGSRCDEAMLERAALLLEADDPAEDVEGQAVKLLDKACPSLTPGLLMGFASDYSSAPADLMIEVFTQDDAYRTERRKTCAKPDEWIAQAVELSAGERAAAMYETCEFARFGLFAEGESYTMDDLGGVQIYGWLSRNGVDEALGRRFIRGIMSATASKPILERRCRAQPQSVACHTVLLRDDEGLGLPSSDRSWSPPQSVDPAVVFLRAAPQVGEDPATHVIPSIREQLDPERNVVMVADAKASARRLVDAIYTASTSGVQRFWLAARGDHEIVHLAVGAPGRWTSEKPAPRDAALLVVHLHGGKARFVHDGGFVAAHELSDRAAIGGEFKRLATQFEVSHVELRLDDDLSVQDVVHVLDSLRAKDCPAPEAIEQGMQEAAPGCGLRYATLSLSDGIPRTSRDWARLEVAIEVTDKGYNRRKGPESMEKLQARVGARKDRIRACLVDDPDARILQPARFVVMFGSTVTGDLSAVVPHDFGDPAPEACIVEALGLSGPHDFAGPAHAPGTIYAEAIVSVTVPVPVP